MPAARITEVDVFARDLKGREWVVRRTFAPWWRVVQPSVLLGADLRRRRPLPSIPVPRKRRRSEERVDAGTVAAGVVIFILGLPELIMHLVLYVLAWPFALLELVAMGLGGFGLAVLRTFRLVRHRIDLLGVEDGDLRSLTVLLVRGGRRHANALAQGIAATIAESDRIYATKQLPGSVTVVSRFGYWE